MKGLLLTFFCFVISTCAFPQWTKTNGPTGSTVKDIIKISDYLFANSEAAGIFRSDDNGDTWVEANNGLPQYPHCFAFTHFDTLLYASISQAGIYYSSDYGETWSAINTGIENTTSYTLLVNGSHIWAGYSEGGLLFSSDHGSTWTLLNGPVSRQQVSTMAIVNGTLVGAASSKVFKSDDNGQNWVESPLEMTPNNIQAFNNTVYVIGSSNKVFLSENEGASWTVSAPLETNGLSLKSIYAEQDTLYVGGGYGRTFISYNKGMTWILNQSNEIHNSHYDILEDNGLLYLATSDGFYRSADTAKTWSSKNKGLVNGIINHVALDGNTILAGGSSGFYESSDNGDNWMKENPADEIHINGANGVHVIGNIRVMTNGRGVYRSVDHGPWNETLITEPNSSMSILVGNREQLITWVNGQGLYISNDLGDSWNFVTNDLITQSDIRSAYIGGDTLIVGGFNTLLISTDNGENWRSEQLDPVRFIASALRFHNNKFYVAGLNKIYSTSDLGISGWESESTGRSSNIYDFTIVRDTVFLASTDAGDGESVILSYDNGETWHNVGADLMHVTAFAQNEDYIFGSTYGKGVWKMPLDKLNVPPVVVDLKEELTIRQGQSIVISIEDFNVVDPDGGSLTLNVADGENFNVTEGNTLVADREFFGMLTAKVTVNDGFNNGKPFEMNVEVTENIRPEITGTEGEFIIEKNQPLRLSLSNINVADPDDTTIGLEILPGENYTVSAQEVLPDDEFTGELQVSVVANDGFQDSEIFELTIKVVELITDTEQTPDKFSVYPIPAEHVLIIESRTSTMHSFDLCDVMGKRVIEQRPLHQGKNEIDVRSVPPGVYFLKVAGNKTIRVIKR